MKQIIKDNNFFLLPYIFFLFIAGLILLIYSKSDIHIATNQFYNNFFDTFFIYFTKIGDGLIISLLIIIMFFVKYRYFVISLISMLLSVGVIQILKHIFVTPRPVTYFMHIYTGDYSLRIIENIDIHVKYSLPSGHTTTAFVVFLFLSLITKPKYKFLKIIYLLIAIIVGFSRIYLSQHFLIDVVVGSIIGVLITIFTYYFTNKIKNPYLDKSLIKTIF